MGKASQTVRNNTVMFEPSKLDLISRGKMIIIPDKREHGSPYSEDSVPKQYASEKGPTQA
jgi:hypothetical protein